MGCTSGLDPASIEQLLGNSAAAIFNCLGDADMCNTAVEVLQSMLSSAPTSAVSSSLPALVKSLLLVFPNGDESCRNKVAVLIGQVAEMQNGAVKADLVAALKAAPDLLQVPELSQIVN